MGWISSHKVWTAVIVVAALLIIAAMSGQDPAATTASSSPPGVTTPPVTTTPPPSNVTVPGVVGKGLDEAEKKLESAGLTVVVTRAFSGKRLGTVLRVSVEEGSEVEAGTSVSLTVAKAIPEVPNVVGLTQSAATSKLKKAGYTVVVKKVESSQKAGTVVSSNPGPGTARLPGKPVTINVAKTPPPSPPDNNCTPGYSPCLAPASDYDCAGGSGDGPKYVYGTVTVTGSDPYGLDSDNDGYGCE
jgi:beta-lactam-binding protein with PASTA domain